MRLVDSDPRWPRDFEQMRSCLFQATDGWISHIEHIGGTALPFSIARPVLDAIAGLDDLNGFEPSANLIEGLNYERIPLPAWAAGQLGLLFQKSREGIPTHRVWLLAFHGPLWMRLSQMSDWLKKHPQDVERLSYLKGKIAEWAPLDSNEYELAKHSYFVSIEDQIRATQITIANR